MDRDALSRRRLLRTLAVTAAAPLFAWPVMVRAQEAEVTIEVTVAPVEPTVPPEPTATMPVAEPTTTPPPEVTAITPPDPTVTPSPTASFTESRPESASTAASRSTVDRKGSVTAAFESATLGASGPLPYDAAARVIAGALTVTVADDRTGSALGWSVALVAGSFRYQGDSAGLDIPASAVRIVSAGLPVSLRGQSVNASGPFAGDTIAGVTLDTPRVVMRAVAGGGRGAYRVTIAIELTVPPFARPGRYTSTVFLTVNTAP